MDYTNFKNYPLNILGIDESYDIEIKAIEQVVINDIAYSGEIADLENVLPYFVFFKFCEDKQTVASIKGEMAQVAEFSVPSILLQVRAWNAGAKMLLDICTENETTANENYQSQRQLL